MNNPAEHPPEAIQQQCDAAALEARDCWDKLHDPALAAIERLKAYAGWRAAVERRASLRTHVDDQNLV